MFQKAGPNFKAVHRLFQKEGPNLNSLYLCKHKLPINEALTTGKGRA